MPTAPMMPLRRASLLLLLFATLPARPLSAQIETITEERVRQAVTWLAADERRGRDTGSVELQAAADWLAARFAAAGLQQVSEGTWFRPFTLRGLQLDSDGVKLCLVQTRGDDSVTCTLEPGRDVRLWTASAALLGEKEPCTVARIDDAALQGLLTASAARRPIVVEVPEDHVYWLKAAGVHSVLGGRRAASRPVFLVRQGLLPTAPDRRGLEGWSATWSVAKAEPGEVVQNNVVALLPGKERKDEYVVVSAHYDHIGMVPARNGDSICNGADDDASGTTAVLLLAEAMAKLPPMRRSVLFVCFAAEEKGMLGSAAFCDDPPVPLDKVKADLNIEMIGRPEPGNEKKAWITGDDLSDFAAIAQVGLERAGVGLVDFRMSAMLFAQSDNFSFARHGVVAHSLSAGSLHADYHQPGDEVEKLDIPHMTQIVRGLFEAVREFADRDGAPAWNEKGKQRLEPRRR